MELVKISIDDLIQWFCAGSEGIDYIYLIFNSDKIDELRKYYIIKFSNVKINGEIQTCLKFHPKECRRYIGDLLNKLNYNREIYISLKEDIIMSEIINIESTIDTKREVALKDIINWCSSHPTHQAAEKLMLIITDEKLNTDENMEKMFIINHIPFEEFLKAGKAYGYLKYLGYSLYCVSK